MTVQEYYEQAKMVSQKIDANLAELAELRRVSEGISAVSMKEDKVASSRSTDAIFIRQYERIEKYEEQLKDQIDLMLDLRQQIMDTINAVPDPNQRAVLEMRYLRDYSFSRIQEELDISRPTAYAWHSLGLANTVLPVNPIILSFSYRVKPES